MMVIATAFQLMTFFGVDNLIDCTGDRKELAAQYVQLVANESQFPRGESKVKWKYQSRDKKVLETVECLLRWDGDRTGWEWESIRIDPKVANSKPIKSTLRRLLTPEGDHFFSPGDNPRYESSASQPSTIRPQFALRPDQLWFNYRPNVPWSHFFIREKYPPNVFRCELRKEGDLLFLRRVNVEANLYGVITFSRAMGGNVVSVVFGEVDDASRPSSSSFFKEKIDCEWARLSDGRWRLTRFFRTIDRPDRKGKLNSDSEDLEILVETFNPDPKWDSNYLTPRAFFKLPDDTLVLEETPAGTRRYLNVQRDAMPQDHLDSLARSLRARGFAVP